MSDTIYTSYYGGIPKISLDNPQLISISRSYPRNIPGILHEIAMAPDEPLLRLYKAGAVDAERYTHIYMTQLNKARALALAKSWKQSERPVVLLCYEVPSAFCHRHVLADYLNKMGYDVREYHG